ASRGFGANVVSRGEWAIARRAGVADGRITLEGVGKTDADLRAAVRAAATRSPLLWVALESADEAEVVTRMARRAGLGRGDRPALDVLVRLNPEVTPETIAVRAVDAWRDAVRRGLAVVGLLGGGLDAFDTLDVGGGFPILPLDEAGTAPD